MAEGVDLDLFLSDISIRMGINKSDVWKRQFQVACTWVATKGYGVNLVTDKGDEVVWDSNCIMINKNHKWETRYYSLLHEIGHILVAEDKKQFLYDYPLYIEYQTRGRKSHAYRVSTIGEEIEAWKKGRVLGDKVFNHFINYDKYNKLMTDCVMSYVKWAAEV